MHGLSPTHEILEHNNDSIESPNFVRPQQAEQIIHQKA